MTRADLRTDEQFLAWLSTEATVANIGKLARVIDTEVSRFRYPVDQPHLVHINYGRQEAIQAIADIFRDPTGAALPNLPVGTPRPNYGVAKDP